MLEQKRFTNSQLFEGQQHRALTQNSPAVNHETRPIDNYLDGQSSSNSGRVEFMPQLRQILENMSYFAGSVKKIDNLQTKYPLLFQFTLDEHKFKKIDLQLQNQPQILNRFNNSLNQAF